LAGRQFAPSPPRARDVRRSPASSERHRARTHRRRRQAHYGSDGRRVLLVSGEAGLARPPSWPRQLEAPIDPAPAPVRHCEEDLATPYSSSPRHSALLAHTEEEQLRETGRGTRIGGMRLVRPSQSDPRPAPRQRPRTRLGALPPLRSSCSALGSISQQAAGRARARRLQWADNASLCCYGTWWRRAPGSPFLVLAVP